MEPQVVGAFISLGSVIIGLVIRDIVMALHLSKQKRETDAQEKADEHARQRHDLVKLYADPLRESVISLRNRLSEITNTAQGRYLRADAPPSPFTEYKRISTIYRLAVVLGWVQAFRRERSYLDPATTASADEAGKVIGGIEVALADGQHVEQQRLEELASLWKVAPHLLSDSACTASLATEIDAARREFLREKDRLSPSDLEPADQFGLALRCANLIGNITKSDIPEGLVRATTEEATVYLGIKEAYIYRDWQCAIGDMMISTSGIGGRRFDVMGYRDFEERYLAAAAQDGDTPDKRWFGRLDAIFHDLDMQKSGIFDARREQVRKLYSSCNGLQEYLDRKLETLKGGDRSTRSSLFAR
ncbi:hypothetical protein T8K17_25285 [Thalassobaculum sp. OXR-137]|uniref:hypothetical protein n=1 Tax=Thalassobaculum sp. OXR-137 TaxID=3100173 RepID=UPI002AC8E634|nr:hypothetical protein [Thalassobaculum sp. OXR-137]WPZ34524.1 hypothetical protein T8K17_25285 [Thalassobaculum sp. OXR-137]